MSFIKIPLILGVLFLGVSQVAGCQLTPKTEYAREIREVSQSQKFYNGFQQTFEATITPMDRKVSAMVLKKKGEVLGWTPAHLERELSERQEDLLTHSHFFLRFYAPNSDYDDLHKPNSIWKVYLVLGDQQYEGQVKKDFSKLAQLQTLYPYFDRFSTGYEITFPVGQSSLEDRSYSVLLTSSLGQAQFQF